MHPLRLEACLLGEPAEDEERPGAGQRTALGVQEEFGPATAVEERPATGEVAPDGVDRLAPERDDPFLVALAEWSDEPLLEVDAGEVQPDGLAYTQAGSVKELDQGAVAQSARTSPPRSGDEALDLSRRQRAGKPAPSARKVDGRRRIVRAHAEEHEVPIERAGRRKPPRNRGRRQPASP